MRKWLTVCLAAILLMSVPAACGASGTTAVRQEMRDESTNANQFEGESGNPPPQKPRENSARHGRFEEDSGRPKEGPRESNADMPYAVELRTVQIPAPSLSNNLIGEPDVREISVLLPQSYYHNEDRYPVVYFLNGYGSPHDNSARLAYYAMMELSVEDLMIVCIDAVSLLNCSYYVNSPVTGNWQDFVTNDVVNYIDSNYRTVANASGRGISGHSIGGFGAVNIALNTEGIYSHVYAMSPAVLAPDGLITYGLQLEPIHRLIQEYHDLSAQESRERYLQKLRETSWQPRYAFDYGSAFVYDETGKAPYILIPERVAAGEYLRGAVWERYQNGLGGPPRRIAESRNRLLRLDGLVVEYGSRDELTWVLDGCKYLAEQLNEHGIPFDLRVYDGDHTSEIPRRLISDVLPYFAQNLNQ